MFSPQPAFIHSIRFDNLAAIEAYQEGQQADATFQAWGNKVAQCLAQPQAVLLYEELVATGLAEAPKFLLRIRQCPAPGKGPELRALMEERVKGRGPGLVGAGLSEQVASLDGPAFAATLLFASMAGMDEFRAASRKDPAFQGYVNQVAALTRVPSQQRVQRILAPFPARG